MRLMMLSYLLIFLINKLKKMHGPTRIKQEMRQKRFPAALIEQGIDSGDIDWYQLAKEARIKKFGDALPSEPKEKNKQIRHLQYKGFTMDMIFEALG